MPWIDPALLATLEGMAQQNARTDATELGLQLKSAISHILRWLQRITLSVEEHKATQEYKDAAARAGRTKGESGLSPAQLQERQELQAAKDKLKEATKLDAEWRTSRWNSRRWQRWQEDLLQKFWHGGGNARQRS